MNEADAIIDYNDEDDEPDQERVDTAGMIEHY